MKSIGRKQDEDVAVISTPEHILCNRRRIATPSITATPIENPPAPQSEKAALEEPAVHDPRLEGEDTLDNLSDRPTSEERRA